MVNISKRIFIAYLCLSFVIGSGIFYAIGSTAKRPYYYVYINYQTAERNLFKTLNKCGIVTTRMQQQAIFDELKKIKEVDK